MSLKNKIQTKSRVQSGIQELDDLPSAFSGRGKRYVANMVEGIAKLPDEKFRKFKEAFKG